MEKIIIYWRDIPSQVIVKKGRLKEKGLVEAAFSECYRPGRNAGAQTR